MAKTRNYEEYRTEILEVLGVQYTRDDILNADRWKRKVYEGLTKFPETGTFIKEYLDKVDANIEAIAELSDEITHIETSAIEVDTISVYREMESYEGRGYIEIIDDDESIPENAVGIVGWEISCSLLDKRYFSMSELYISEDGLNLMLNYNDPDETQEREEVVITLHIIKTLA